MRCSELLRASQPLLPPPSPPAAFPQRLRQPSAVAELGVVRRHNTSFVSTSLTELPLADFIAFAKSTLDRLHTTGEYITASDYPDPDELFSAFHAQATKLLPALSPSEPDPLRAAITHTKSQWAEAFSNPATMKRTKRKLRARHEECLTLMRLRDHLQQAYDSKKDAKTLRAILYYDGLRPVYRLPGENISYDEAR